jgi:hypothetical protein
MSYFASIFNNNFEFYLRVCVLSRTLKMTDVVGIANRYLIKFPEFSKILYLQT